MSVSALQSPGPDPAESRKAVLYCPACGHASPVDGDWVVSAPDRRRYACPDCEATVVEQPTF